MAFTTRASKDTGGALVLGNTPPEVGPGSYGSDASRHAHTAPAPFCTTADRSPVVRPDAAAMPGPGSYSAQGRQATAAVLRAAARETPAFASEVDRFAADKATPATTPGPGAYKPRQSWTKDALRGQSAPSERQHKPNHLHMAASRQLLAGPTAPTIPAPHQSYGYERGQNGSWVLQPPPAAQAGDAAQQAASSSGGAGSRGTAWGASKTARLVSRDNPVPGPGSYAAEDAGQHSRWRVDSRGRLNFAGGRPGIAPAAKGTSSFAATSRNLEGPAEPEPHTPQHLPTPGPGAYQLPPSFRPPDLNRTSQAFFTTSKRTDPLKTSSTRGSQPGPGAYSAPSAFSGSSHGGQGPTPFLSMAQRFGACDNTTPGPGNYATQDLLGVCQEVGKKLASKHGTFGPSSQRLTAGRAAAAAAAEAAAEEAAGLSVVEGTPGPGGYDVAVVAVNVRDAGRASAAFASATQRFKTRPSVAASAAKAPAMGADAPPHQAQASSSGAGDEGSGGGLGPGHYKLQDEWAAQKVAARSHHHHAPFGSETDRFAVRNHDHAVSGPAASAADVAFAAPPRNTAVRRPAGNGPAARKAGFASGGARFRSHDTPSPGPGAHTDHSSGFVKRSFNVTVDGW